MGDEVMEQFNFKGEKEIREDAKTLRQRTVELDTIFQGNIIRLDFLSQINVALSVSQGTVAKAKYLHKRIGVQVCKEHQQLRYAHAHDLWCEPFYKVALQHNVNKHWLLVVETLNMPFKFVEDLRRIFIIFIEDGIRKIIICYIDHMGRLIYLRVEETSDENQFLRLQAGYDRKERLQLTYNEDKPKLVEYQATIIVGKKIFNESLRGEKYESDSSMGLMQSSYSKASKELRYLKSGDLTLPQYLMRLKKSERKFVL